MFREVFQGPAGLRQHRGKLRARTPGEHQLPRSSLPCRPQGLLMLVWAMPRTHCSPVVLLRKNPRYHVVPFMCRCFAVSGHHAWQRSQNRPTGTSYRRGGPSLCFWEEVPTTEPRSGSVYRPAAAPRQEHRDSHRRPAKRKEGGPLPDCVPLLLGREGHARACPDVGGMCLVAHVACGNEVAAAAKGMQTMHKACIISAQGVNSMLRACNVKSAILRLRADCSREAPQTDRCS